LGKSPKCFYLLGGFLVFTRAAESALFAGSHFAGLVGGLAFSESALLAGSLELATTGHFLLYIWRGDFIYGGDFYLWWR
jgi:hypothetical protein